MILFFKIVHAIYQDLGAPGVVYKKQDATSDE
jgi:hypothetical protein